MKNKVHVIVIESSCYKVNTEELYKLQEMQKNDKSDHENTMRYLDANKHKYTFVGNIHFDCRR